MTRLHRWWLPALLASALAFAACGGDDDEETPKTDAGLDGGSDAGRDASTTPTDAGSDASASAGLQCKTPATSKCGPFTSPVGTPPEPCCYSGPLSNGTTADSVCSGRYMGTCLPPAINDTRCDNITILGTPYAGCCTLQGQCGINSNQGGLGCPDLVTTENTVKMLISGFSIPAASKRACAAGDAGTTQPLVRSGIDAGL